MLKNKGGNTLISKNLGGENSGWQLLNRDCMTERNCGFHIMTGLYSLTNVAHLVKAQAQNAVALQHLLLTSDYFFCNS